MLVIHLRVSRETLRVWFLALRWRHARVSLTDLCKIICQSLGLGVVLSAAETLRDPNVRVSGYDIPSRMYGFSEEFGRIWVCYLVFIDNNARVFFQISNKGYVSLEQMFLSRTMTEGVFLNVSSVPLIAPFWADFETSVSCLQIIMMIFSSSSVCYRILRQQ